MASYTLNTEIEKYIKAIKKKIEIRDDCYSVQENKSRLCANFRHIFDHFQTQSLRGRSFLTAIFNSDIQLSVYSFSCFISVCRFVALLKATYAENPHIVLSCRY